MTRHPQVLILYHRLPGDAVSESDAGVLHEVAAVEAALKELDVPNRSVAVSRLTDLQSILSTAVEEHVVFNLVEELAGEAEDYNLVPAVCRTFGKSATGGDAGCLLLTLDKWRTKAVLKAAGLPVPEGIVVAPGKLVPADLFPGPFIVKPAARDASEGISDSCVFETAGAEMDKAIGEMHARYGQPVLVEQYVGMREFNVSLRETEDGVEVLPLAEIEFVDYPPEKKRVICYTAKWMPDSFEYKHTRRIVPANLSEATAEKIRSIALAAWDVTRCRDYARIDMRMDETGHIFILEINANPDVSPDAGYAAALTAAGISFREFVGTVIGNAWKRLGSGGVEAAIDGDDAEESRLRFGIRMTQRSDRESVLKIVEETEFFRSNEVDIAREVLDDAIVKGADGHYQSFVSVSNGEPVGWISYGPTPCTEGTYDVYWVVVARKDQGKGVGKALMIHAEKLIAERGGRLCVAETSSRAMYDATRAFYRKIGYDESASVADFYAAGDNKVIYTKRLTALL